MKFTEWAKLREADGLTQPSGQNLVNAPSSAERTALYNPSVSASQAKTRFDTGSNPNRNKWQKQAPTGSPSGKPHSHSEIEEARVQLGKLNDQARSILDYVKSSDHWQSYPQFQKAFLEKMRKAIDGLTESQAILSADSGYKRPNDDIDG